MKTALVKLVTSPDGKGFMGSPLVFFVLGAAFMLYAFGGALTGEIDVGRYSSNVVRYATMPLFFGFSVATLFLLGAGLAWWGWRRMRLHDD